MSTEQVAVTVAFFQFAGICVGAVFSYLGLKQGQRTHTQINGRMDQLLDQKGKASQGIGEKIGEKRERDRADADADKPDAH